MDACRDGASAATAGNATESSGEGAAVLDLTGTRDFLTREAAEDALASMLAENAALRKVRRSCRRHSTLLTLLICICMRASQSRAASAHGYRAGAATLCLQDACEGVSTFTSFGRLSSTLNIRRRMVLLADQAQHEELRDRCCRSGGCAARACAAAASSWTAWGALHWGRRLRMSMQ